MAKPLLFLSVLMCAQPVTAEKWSRNATSVVLLGVALAITVAFVAYLIVQFAYLRKRRFTQPQPLFQSLVTNPTFTRSAVFRGTAFTADSPEDSDHAERNFDRAAFARWRTTSRRPSAQNMMLLEGDLTIATEAMVRLRDRCTLTLAQLRALVQELQSRYPGGKVHRQGLDDALTASTGLSGTAASTFTDAVFRAFDENEKGIVGTPHFAVFLALSVRGAVRDRFSTVFNVFAGESESDQGAVLGTSSLRELLRAMCALSDLNAKVADKRTVAERADALLGLMEAQQGGSGAGEEVFVRTCAADAGLLRIFPSSAVGSQTLDPRRKVGEYMSIRASHPKQSREDSDASLPGSIDN